MEDDAKAKAIKEILLNGMSSQSAKDCFTILINANTHFDNSYLDEYLLKSKLVCFLYDSLASGEVTIKNKIGNSIRYSAKDLYDSLLDSSCIYGREIEGLMDPCEDEEGYHKERTFEEVEELFITGIKDEINDIEGMKSDKKKWIPKTGLIALLLEKVIMKEFPDKTQTQRRSYIFNLMDACLDKEVFLQPVITDYNLDLYETIEIRKAKWIGYAIAASKKQGVRQIWQDMLLNDIGDIFEIL